MKVVKWIPYGEQKGLEEAFGGMGGWFNWTEKGQRWKDYLAVWKEEVHPYIEAFREEVLRRELRVGADWHQYGPGGVPVFEDGKYASFSYRAWGDIMAAIWSEKEDRDYTYMDFYMNVDVERQ